MSRIIYKISIGISYMDKKSLLDSNKDLIFIYTIYIIITLLLLRMLYLHAGADGISYIFIAKYYAAGNWFDAINGYWSPLYSWLMTPFFLFKLNPYQSAYVPRIISFIAGLFIIICVRRLMNILECDKSTKIVIQLSILPIIIFATIIYDTPDLTLVAVILYYFSLIFSPNYSIKSFNGILCGIMGALAYLSKSYMFPFFLVHFISFNFYYYFKSINRKQKHIIFKNLVFGLIVFFTISGLWAGMISEKYGEFTIGTAGEYNHALLGHTSNLHPIHFKGLIKPPNENSISIWEDPTYVKLKDWSAFSSSENFNYEIRLVWSNILETISIIEYYSIFSIFIIILSIYLFFRREITRSVHKNLLFLLLTMLIYSGGYLYIFTAWRYLLPLAFLLMITGFYLIDILYKIRWVNIKVKYLLLIVLMLSFAANPVYDLIKGSDFDGKSFELIETLKNDYQIHGNIASKGPQDLNWEDVPNGFDPYMVTLMDCYYLNCKYYGVPKKTSNYTQMENELEANNITYFFVWNSTENFQFSDYKEITNGKLDGLRIYEKT
jgi:hypothetical protein